MSLIGVHHTDRRLHKFKIMIGWICRSRFERSTPGMQTKKHC